MLSPKIDFLLIIIHAKRPLIIYHQYLFQKKELSQEQFAILLVLELKTGLEWLPCASQVDEAAIYKIF